MKKLLLYLFLIPVFSYAQSLTNGLIGYYPLDGNAIEQSGNNLNGIISNTSGIESNSGVKDSALFFNGASFITVGDYFDVGLEDLSISAWVKIDSLNNIATLTIAGKYENNGTGPRYGFAITGNRPRVYFQWGSQAVDLRGTKMLNDSNWHNIICVFNRSSELKIYVDGILNASVDISASNNIDVQTNYKFRIGAFMENYWIYKGGMDDLRIYNRALSEEEILLLAENLENITICESLYCDGENVGVGTPITHGNRLAVAGSAIAEKVQVTSQLAWPDYVFKQDYNLVKLKDIEIFIKENKHLPKIPDAKKILQNGYDLGEMDVLLLEKIEELTLHIIEQNYRISALRSKAGILEAPKVVSDPYVYRKVFLVNDIKKTPLSPTSTSSSPNLNFSCSAIFCDGQNVGIGTTNTQGNKLAVAGGILAESIKIATQANWPDYVFFEDYQLLDLGLLESYINNKGHLPGVPNAREIEKKGYSLSDMDALFLKKIEELTLYMIDQNRQIKEVNDFLGINGVSFGDPYIEKGPEEEFSPAIVDVEKGGEDAVLKRVKLSEGVSINCGSIFCDGDNIGIGTSTTQGFKLAVAGNILSQQVKISTQADWPDYVFEISYELQPLEQLGEFIKKNGHLPQVPDASSVASDGYFLGAMDAILLEKIEELFLYAIDQDKNLLNLEAL